MTHFYYPFKEDEGESVRMFDGTVYKVDINGWRKVRKADRHIAREERRALHQRSK